MSANVNLSATNEAAKYRVRIAAGKHEIIADEPEAAGGADTGVNPHQLLAASLAACTAITVRMYAERKGWDTGSLDVDIALESEKGDTKISRKLTFGKPLAQDIHERLLAVANACPVHKVLTGKIAIETA